MRILREEGAEVATDMRNGVEGVVRLTIPARPEYITLSRLALTGLSRARPLSAETLADLKLAITEACSNSVRHAYGADGGTVEIRYELHPDRLVIEVADEGTGFVSPEARRLAEEDEFGEGGLGIAIIRAVADELEIGSGQAGRGSLIRFAKRFAD